VEFHSKKSAIQCRDEKLVRAALNHICNSSAESTQGAVNMPAVAIPGDRRQSFIRSGIYSAWNMFGSLQRIDAIDWQRKLFQLGAVKTEQPFPSAG